jgi:hypothetical protein
MYVEKLKKKEECMIYGFLQEGARFYPLGWLPPSLLSFFLYLRKP